MNSEQLNNLLISIAELSKKLISEIGDYYPLLHYFKNGKISSITVADIDNGNNYYEIIYKYIDKNEIENYVVSENLKQLHAIKLIICRDKIEYEPVYIGYRMLEKNIEFSKLLEFKDLKQWLG